MEVKKSCGLSTLTWGLMCCILQHDTFCNRRSVVSKNEEVVAGKAIQSGKMKKYPHHTELLKGEAIKMSILRGRFRIIDNRRD